VEREYEAFSAREIMPFAEARVEGIVMSFKHCSAPIFAIFAVASMIAVSAEENRKNVERFARNSVVHHPVLERQAIHALPHRPAAAHNY
jgi:hypothetical protein